ncbi:hypothetical protein ScalyP_jg2049 [Parmales sp. scaly parma]|nr:hypothetical protein ScalyP_jg2049 [Parmales sp. scaly parma]
MRPCRPSSADAFWPVPDNPNIFFTSPTNKTSFARAASISPVALTIAIVNPNSSASSVGLPPFAEEQIWSKTFSTPRANTEHGGGGAGPSAVRIAFPPSTVLLSLPMIFSAVSALRFTDLRLQASA